MKKLSILFFIMATVFIVPNVKAQDTASGFEGQYTGICKVMEKKAEIIFIVKNNGPNDYSIEATIPYPSKTIKLKVKSAELGPKRNGVTHFKFYADEDEVVQDFYRMPASLIGSYDEKTNSISNFYAIWVESEGCLLKK